MFSSKRPAGAVAGLFEWLDGERRGMNRSPGWILEKPTRPVKEPYPIGAGELRYKPHSLLF